MKLIKLDMPQYTVEVEPDHVSIGTVIDDELKKYFMNKSVLVRGVASSEHPGKNIEELVEIIITTGTDRYDLGRVGDRYENVEGKHIDLFAFPEVITTKSRVFEKIVWGFYHSAKEIHGYPMRIDVILVYDASQMQQVTHRYAGRGDVKDDGFAFKDPKNQVGALAAIIQIS